MDYSKPFSDLTRYIPLELRNDANTSLINNLFNRFLTHEEVTPLFGLIGKPKDPADPADKAEVRPFVPQDTFERELNTLLPLIVGDVGSERHVFSLIDLLNRAQQLGIHVEDFAYWGAEQVFNWVPPINLDKFVNFPLYYWIGKTLTHEAPAWNPDQEPEYYVCSRPSLTDRQKEAVQLATTTNISLTGTGYPNIQTWTVEFHPTGELDQLGEPMSSWFTVTSDFWTSGATFHVDSHFDNGLISFDIVRGSLLRPFKPGDKFELTVFTLVNYTEQTFTGSGNGLLTNLKSELDFQVVDGVKLKVGDRVLVKNQVNVEENGIYEVAQVEQGGFLITILQKTLDSQGPNGIIVEVLHGLTQSGWWSAQAGSITTFQPSQPGYVNDWVASNQWIHVSDLAKYELDVSDTRIVAAQRPIIEFHSAVELNTGTDSNGIPTAPTLVVHPLIQSKERFNQLPLFNVYNFDGTHTGKVSSLFFYEEDQAAPVDQHLKRRVVTNSDADFSFGQGLLGPNNEQLFYRQDGTLKGIWCSGNMLAPRLISNGTEQAWKTPPQLFFNLGHENRDKVLHGDLLNHMMSIIQRQLGLTGSFFGSNNLRELDVDVGLGGLIHDFNGPFNVLISLLCQQNISVTSIIDFAESQYLLATSSLTEFLKLNLAQSLADNKGWNVSSMFDSYLVDRQGRHEVNTTYNDSTSPIPTWPLTLPLMGLAQAVQPRAEFDLELNMDVIVFHDGHRAPSVIFEKADIYPIVNQTIIVDGVEKTGVISAIAPTEPFAGMLWHNPTSGQTFVFVNGNWVAINFTAISNDLTLFAENILYAEQQKPYSALTWVPYFYQADLEFEFARWAAQNGIDPYASDFDPANAFTWNYKEFDFAPPFTRWQEIYQSIFGTSRPDIEPWKLLGLTNKPADWDTQFKTALVSPTNNVTSVQHVVNYNINLSSTPNFLVDFYGNNIPLAANQTILVINQTNPALNGIYRVFTLGTGSDGIWVRTTNFDAAYKLPVGLTVNVSANEWAGATFVLTTAPTTLHVDPIEFTQHRLWSEQMWQYLDAQLGKHRFAVNVHTDELLPPYVSNTKWASVDALTTTVPNNPTIGYSFGEYGPAEAIWRKSLEFNYGLLRASMKRDPIRFLKQTWGSRQVKVGDLELDRYYLHHTGQTELRLHGDLRPAFKPNGGTCTYSTVSGQATLKVVNVPVEGPVTFELFVDDQATNVFIREGEIRDIAFGSFSATGLSVRTNGVPYVYGDVWQVGTTNTFIPATSVVFFGLNQLYTNLRRYNSLLTETSYNATFFNNWQVKFGYRVGGLLDTDHLSLENDNFQLASAVYEPHFKRNVKAFGTWAQALRVQVVQVDPYDKLEGETTGAWRPGKKVAEVYNKVTNTYDRVLVDSRAENWVFRVEGFNPRYPQLLRFVNDKNGNFETFNALDKRHTDLELRRYTDILDVVTEPLPKLITGLDNLLDFLHGYVQLLDASGWRFNAADLPAQDAETGRSLSWELEIEKLVDYVYAGVLLGQGHQMNPMIPGLWFETKTGLVAPFEHANYLDMLSSQLCFDILGNTINTEDLQTVRLDGKTTVSSNVVIYSAHLFVDEYEHVILFEDYAADNNKYLIYDPFLGVCVKRLLINGRQQRLPSKRPSFGGFYLQGHEVKRNPVSSIDTVGNYYSAEAAFDDRQTSKQALALLGYSDKGYWDLLGTQDKTRFNFWRGMLKSKGANSAISAFVNSARYYDAAIDEFWAYKLATYGDSRERSFPELRLKAHDCQLTFTQFQLTDQVSPAEPLIEYVPISTLDQDLWFSIDDVGGKPYFEAEKVFELTHTPATIGELLTLDYELDYLEVFNSAGDRVDLEATTPDVSWQTAHHLVFNVLDTYRLVGWGPARPKFSPIKLFDYRNQVLLADIPIWHPDFGIHEPYAYAACNLIQSTDPARYNSTLLTTNNETYDPKRPWGEREVGKIWWNTSNLAYIPYYDAKVFGTSTSTAERLARWGALADYASIDVYEWVKSDVPPTEWNTLALTEAGKANTTSTIKHEGQAAMPLTFSRTRNWYRRTVAWSHVLQPTGTATLFQGKTGRLDLFEDSNDTWVTISSIIPTADPTVFEYGAGGFLFDAGLGEGMHFSAWINNRPVGEYVMTNTTRVIFGSSSAPLVPGLGTGTTNFDIVRVELPRTTIGVGKVLGKVSFSIDPHDPTTVIASLGDLQQRFTAISWTGNPGDQVKLEFDQLGFAMVGHVTTGITNLDAETIIAELCSSTYDLVLRQAGKVKVLHPCETTRLENRLIIDPTTDVPFDTGWRSWSLPTQDELSIDAPAPYSTWTPIYGTWANINASAADIQAAKETPLTLRDRTEASNYMTDWTDWVQLTDLYGQVLATSDTVILPLIENLNLRRLSVYVNGSLVVNSYFVDDNTDLVTVFNVKANDVITYYYSRYEPSSAELLFDPTVTDDLTLQVQYKIDYQYVEQVTRDTDGGLASSTYYFWVKNKTTAPTGKTMSIQAIGNSLKAGPDLYMVLQHPLKAENGLPVRYDAMAIYGLNQHVQADNTYKLRFTRDFTLRDDPLDLDLKNVHTEWTLLRPNQSIKIPRQLWNLLTDAACGQDIAGNLLPFNRFADYDQRYGTRTRFGFKPGQILVDSKLALETILHTIQFTKVLRLKESKDLINTPDYLDCFDFLTSTSSSNQLAAQRAKLEAYFDTPENIRKSMELIWNTSRPKQLNEIFFETLNDALANNYEFTDLFKTSRISAHSIRVLEQLTGANLIDDHL